MDPIRYYENFPAKIVILSNLVSLSIYGAGFMIMLQAGLIFSLLYLLFILILEFRLIRHHCVNCYYWGKICGFGKGKVSALFFKQGNSSKFCSREMTWKDMIPDMMITLIPLISGIILLIIHFDLILLAGLVMILSLTTAGNGFIRSNKTCRFCKQKEIGCPAEQLFKKEK